MIFNRLLEKQIRKFLGEDFLKEEKIQRFINAVNNSYNAFEKNQALSSHAFKISENEYVKINEHLKEEVALKRQGIKILKRQLIKLKTMKGMLSPSISMKIACWIRSPTSMRR